MPSWIVHLQGLELLLTFSQGGCHACSSSQPVVIPPVETDPETVWD
jgi:hypothetical protein